MNISIHWVTQLLINAKYLMASTVCHLFVSSWHVYSFLISKLNAYSGIQLSLVQIETFFIHDTQIKHEALKIIAD